MKFGITAFVTDEGISPAALGTAVEERGFSCLMVPEHSHIPALYTGPSSPLGRTLPRTYLRTLDPFVTLSSVAAVTRDLALVTGVLPLPQRDVFYTAKEIASLDLISDGRLAVGVGAGGWSREEMRDHGTDPATRGAKMNEQLAALKRIWTEDEAEFHGRFIDFGPALSWPKPVQRPHPPLYVGGESRAALQRLLTLGDGWLPQAATPVEELRRVRRWLADNGRANVPFTIFGAGREEPKLAEYAEAQVEEVCFLLPTQPEPETLHDLDELASLVNRVS
ncbi:LLM class F420-dependent oxidoreductase [Streptomyces sp. TS71-3]|uniref:LLM class F420-dependent oxidoreductase n=1 Tax=Streptomyces sp. TS71-3 TaxID=2733862 RepID=UPI001B24F3E0|nr:LLM class F420-dependent oxidoreductase [Streptomyces sp. TS71-3]GHJ36929.1 LLM class F420-dependent oxidoreductase [Streptomyces sp. TS71-3]